MAPDWYKPDPKPKKRKASTALTKDLEKKKKKPTHVVADDDDMLGATIPTRR